MNLRRSRLRTASLVAAILFAYTGGAAAQTPVKFSIDWAFQGHHAPFAVALQKKYFEREGLAVTMDRGRGSGDTIAKVAAGTYDIGYGDVNTLVKFNHDFPDRPVVAVFMVYPSTPAGVVTLKANGINEPKDLVGKKVASPTSSAARILFPAFAKAVGLKEDAIEWVSVQENLRDALLYQGKADAVASYAPTTVLALGALGVTKDQMVVFPYAKYIPGLLGSGVLVTPTMLKEKPQVVRAFVRAVIAGLQDTLKDPKAAVAMLTQFDRLVDVKGETERLESTIAYSMQNPILKQKGLGSVAPDQLREGVNIMAEISGIPAPGDLASIYNEGFLPPSTERQF
jgi:NitT/TauT family transport system substrate-binding protein